MNSDFCLYLKFLKELVTGVYNYRSYGDAEANYALGILNRVVKENMGLFTLSSDVFENYKKMVYLLGKKINKEVIRANTYILELETSLLKKDDYIKYFSSLHNLDCVDVKEMIIFDSDILSYIIYHDAFYNSKYDNPKYLKASIDYFLKKNPDDKVIYDSFRKYYYNKNIKKQGVFMDIRDILYIKSKLTKGIIGDIILLYDPREFLSLVNIYAKENIGLFCLSDNILTNYQKILNHFEDKRFECKREFFASYAIIMFIESLSEDERKNLGLAYLESEREKHGLSYLSVQKMFKLFDYDWLVYCNYLHNLTFYDNADCEKYVRASFRYFKNIDKVNIPSYNKMIEKYRREKIVFLDEPEVIMLPVGKNDGVSGSNGEIIKFPNRKRKILNIFFKK